MAAGNSEFSVMPGVPYRRFIAPPCYVQGPDAIDRLGELLAGRAGSVVVLVDEAMLDVLSPRLRKALDAVGIHSTILANSGEVTASHVEEQAAKSGLVAADLMVAVGGGKTLDTGKGVGRELEIAVVTVPTIASNDGPTSRVIATYDEEHRLIATPTMRDNPVMVVADTAILAAAPKRYLLSGIGDAVAKRFEADACAKGSGMTSNGGRPLVLPRIVAEGCYYTLLADSVRAVEDVQRGRVSDVVERVIEAVILMSGLAFENGGLSLAHSLTRGLTVVDPTHAQLHGFQVAYGLLVQLEHESRHAAAGEVRSLFHRLELPTCLSELGVAADPDVMRRIIQPTLQAPHMANCIPEVTAESLLAAMRRVEVMHPARG